MKRWITLLCVGLLLLAAGCKGEQMAAGNHLSSAYDTDPNIDQTMQTDYVALTVTKAGVQGGKRFLTVAWKNISGYEIVFGAAFDILTVQDGEEISCAKEDIAFNEIAYILPADDTWEETYDLSMFDLTDGVVYTFTANYFVHDGNDTVHGQARLGFTIDENGELNVSDMYDLSGIYVTVESCESERDKVVLTVVWHNETPWDVVYGSDFDIERFDGEEWTSCAVADICFAKTEQALEADTAPQTKTYTLSFYCYDLVAGGTYRFVSDCSVDLPTGTQKKAVSVEFTI